MISHTLEGQRSESQSPGREAEEAPKEERRRVELVRSFSRTRPLGTDFRDLNLGAFLGIRV